MRAKKVAAIVLAGMLGVSLLAGCGQIDQNAVVGTVSGDEVPRAAGVLRGYLPDVSGRRGRVDGRSVQLGNEHAGFRQGIGL